MENKQRKIMKTINTLTKEIKARLVEKEIIKKQLIKDEKERIQGPFHESYLYKNDGDMKVRFLNKLSKKDREIVLFKLPYVESHHLENDKERKEAKIKKQARKEFQEQQQDDKYINWYDSFYYKATWYGYAKKVINAIKNGWFLDKKDKEFLAQYYTTKKLKNIRKKAQEKLQAKRELEIERIEKIEKERLAKKGYVMANMSLKKVIEFAEKKVEMYNELAREMTGKSGWARNERLKYYSQAENFKSIINLITKGEE